MLRLSAVQTLALNYSGRGVYLSGDSLALLLSLNQYCDLHNWQGLALDRELTQSEIDEIEALSAKAYREIMADNPMIGTVFFSASGQSACGLLCDGGAYDRVDYPQLYAVLDTVFIVDANTFSVPDLIGRMARGTDDAPNVSGGTETHTLTIAEIPSHNHIDAGHTHIESGAALSLDFVGEIPAPATLPAPSVTATGFANIQNTGGGGAHNNLQPSLGVHFIVYGGKP